VPVPEDMQGKSLLPLLKGKMPPDWRKSMYYHYYEYPAEHSVHRHYGIRTDRYKLIRFYHGIDEWELFDLRKDPREMRSVYDDPTYAGVVEDLKKQLKKLRADLGDDNGPDLK
jgi:arylsulfatase A-like enzyme